MQLVNAEAILETERLQLEPLQPKHAIALFSVIQAKRIYQYIPQDPPTSLKALEQRYQKLATRLSPDGHEAWLNWAIYHKQQQVYIGQVEATVLANRVCQIAYLFSPRFWGNGYATESCRQIIIELRQNYRISEVVAEVDTRNLASIQLLQRLGFIRLETRKNADFFKGSSSHEYIYRLDNF
ncbi:MAG: GNAT family N-acetyltransferase [Pleurocapsa sp.]